MKVFFFIAIAAAMCTADGSCCYCCFCYSATVRLECSDMWWVMRCLCWWSCDGAVEWQWWIFIHFYDDFLWFLFSICSIHAFTSSRIFFPLLSRIWWKHSEQNDKGWLSFSLLFIEWMPFYRLLHYTSHVKTSENVIHMLNVCLTLILILRRGRRKFQLWKYQIQITNQPTF